MLTKFPKVSVILPVYNAEKFLNEAIISIANQTFKDFEIIAIDDGSSDNSYNNLLSYKNMFSNIIIERNQKNMGNSYTLNKAIMLSKGEYIMRMDADDIIESIKIQKQLNFLMNNPDIDAVGCSYKRINPVGKKLFIHLVPTSHCEIINLINFRKFFISGPNFEITDGTLMAKAEWFKRWKYDENVYYAQDFDLICRSLSTSKFANLSDVLYSYRISSGVTANISAQISACKVKWSSLKKVPSSIFSKKVKIISYISLFFRPFFYIVIHLYHIIKNHV